jgi:hypothetical protein
MEIDNFDKSLQFVNISHFSCIRPEHTLTGKRRLQWSNRELFEWVERGTFVSAGLHFLNDKKRRLFVNLSISSHRMHFLSDQTSFLNDSNSLFVRHWKGWSSSNWPLSDGWLNIRFLAVWGICAVISQEPLQYFVRNLENRLIYICLIIPSDLFIFKSEPQHFPPTFHLHPSCCHKQIVNLDLFGCWQEE